MRPSPLRWGENPNNSTRSSSGNRHNARPKDSSTHHISGFKYLCKSRYKRADLSRIFLGCAKFSIVNVKTWGRNIPAMKNLSQNSQSSNYSGWRRRPEQVCGARDVSREATSSFLNREAPKFFVIVNFRVELRGKCSTCDALPPVINGRATKGRRWSWTAIWKISTQKVSVIGRSIRSLRKSQKHFPSRLACLSKHQHAKGMRS